MRERRGHEQVLRGHVEVEGLHEREVLEVSLRDEGHGDVEDVELVLLDEVKQEVERPSTSALHRPSVPSGSSTS